MCNKYSSNLTDAMWTEMVFSYLNQHLTCEIVFEFASNLHLVSSTNF